MMFGNTLHLFLHFYKGNNLYDFLFASLCFSNIFTKGNNFSDFPFASLMFSVIFTKANNLSEFLSPTEKLGGYSDEPGVCSSSVRPSIRTFIRKHFCVRSIT